MANEHIIGLRPVHDIRRIRNNTHKGKQATLAFIQHGTSEEGYRYENVCPFCALTVGEVSEEKDPLGFPEEIPLSNLLKALYMQMTVHMKLCTASGTKLNVQLAKHPLGTDGSQKVLLS